MTSAVILPGDCREVLRDFETDSIDAVVTDPPYELGFMGKTWDSTGIAYDVDLWREVLRVLKPGGHVLAFGGTRTSHRMACAIEDAGFEIRDALVWLYGSGFPKSLDVGKKIEDRKGFGTALKPAHEPITLARKPLIGTVAANVLEHGTGAINVDGCRIGDGGDRSSGGPRPAGRRDGWGMLDGGARPAGGRWPANVVLDDEAGAMLDEQSGTLSSHGGGTSTGLGFGSTAVGKRPRAAGDKGGASRFFYCAKASKKERGVYLSCNCETIPAWANEVRKQSVPTGTTLQPAVIFDEASPGVCDCSTSSCGSSITDPCPTGTRSTTSTGSALTTGSKTCEASPPPSTSAFTAGASSQTACGGNRVLSVTCENPSMPRIGICPAKAGRFMGVAAPAILPALSSLKDCDECGTKIESDGHPTQKPIALMRWLVRLVTPPGGIVLDPFTGSGTTGIAAVLEGFEFAGIEQDPTYVALAERRIESATA